MEESVPAKGHHKKHAGPKAEKKKGKKTKQENLTPQQRNPKAFAYHSVNKVAKIVRRSLDVREKKHHIPVVDRTPIEPPPIVVAIVGPPKVGKTTLMQCIIKNFTRQKLNTIKGPVTIVTGKKRRITLIECNNDINCMIDLAKIADLVLLLVDASFGFEMEIFEFLNICQVHGFPKIIGVLTHLDHLRNNKALSTTKKRLKHRFWTEVHQGAKLFYLSGMVNGQYQDTEIRNLGRFISVMKFRPLQWRTTHPHLLTDRMEDVTNPETLRTDPKCDRSICLYGYVRGIHLKNNSHIAIPGCGDFAIHDVSLLPDPCPLPNTEKKRSLNERERLIYAPFSGVGGIVYDKDAVYIDLGGSHAMKAGENGETAPNTAPVNKLVSNIMDTQTTIDQKMETSKLKLFTDTQPISSIGEGREITEVKEFSDGRVRRKAVFSDDDKDGLDEDDENNSEESDIDSAYSDEDNENNENNDFESDSDNDSSSSDSVTDLLDKMVSSDPNEESQKKKAKYRKGGELPESNYASDVSDDGNDADEDLGTLNNSQDSKVSGQTSDDTSSLRWKDNLAAKAQEAFLARQKQTPNLRKLVYGIQVAEGDNSEDEEDKNEDKELGGLFKITKEKNEMKNADNDLRKDNNGLDCSRFPMNSVRDWTDKEFAECIMDCFVTGNWEAEKDAQTLLDQDEELFGDFEDMETGEKQSGAGDDDDDDSGSDDDDEDDKDQEQNDDDSYR